MTAILILLTLLLGVWYVKLLTKYARLWESIPSRNEDHAGDVYKVSVVVPFRNEKNNLLLLIDCINHAKTADLEVEWIFIDDHSDDGGAALFAEHLKENIKWELLPLTERMGKKAAIELAWENATGDILIQTDADCKFDEEWLLAMVAPFSEQSTLLVSGPVQYIYKQGFWHELVALDFAGLIAIGAAHIQWDKPLICNGANMAYRKLLITDIDINAKKASGDDVFILQSAFRKDAKGIVFQNDSRALVWTQSPSSFRDFWHQRIRWASKNGEYDLKENRIILILVWLYNAFIISCFLSMNPIGLTAGCFLVIVKLLAEDRFYSSFSGYFDFSGWFKTILLGQPFHILYMAVIPPLSQMLRYKWKERKQK